MCGGARTKPAQINVDNLQEFVDSVMGEDLQIDAKTKQYEIEQLNRFPGSTFLCVYRDAKTNVLIMDMIWWGINLFKGYKSWSTPIESIQSQNGLKKISHSNRCLVFVSSFMEKKHNFYSHNNKMMVLGGIYKPKKDFPGENQFTFMTQPMSSQFAYIHDRCPVILYDKKMVQKWLDHNPLVSTNFVQPARLEEYLIDYEPDTSLAVHDDKKEKEDPKDRQHPKAVIMRVRFKIDESMPDSMQVPEEVIRKGVVKQISDGVDRLTPTEVVKPPKTKSKSKSKSNKVKSLETDSESEESETKEHETNRSKSQKEKSRRSKKDHDSSDSESDLDTLKSKIKRMESDLAKLKSRVKEREPKSKVYRPAGSKKTYQVKKLESDSDDSS